jgi:hypothetical protein
MNKYLRRMAKTATKINETEQGIIKENKKIKNGRLLYNDSYAESVVIKSLNKGVYVVIHGNNIIIPEDDEHLQKICKNSKIATIHNVKFIQKNEVVHIKSVIVSVDNMLIEYESDDVIHFFEEPKTKYNSIW